MAVVHISLCAHAEEPAGIWRSLGGASGRPAPGRPPQTAHHRRSAQAGEVGPRISSLSVYCLQEQDGGDDIGGYKIGVRNSHVFRLCACLFGILRFFIEHPCSLSHGIPVLSVGCKTGIRVTSCRDAPRFSLLTGCCNWLLQILCMPD